MEQVLVRIPWLIVVAFVAFVAVGCGTSSPPPAAVDVATPEEAANTGSEASVPVVAATGRIPTPVLAINPQPAPQSGQVHVTGKGFGPGESVSISVGKSADAGSERLALATAVASDDGSFSTDSATLTLPDELLSGAHPLDAIGQTSGRRGTATLWIRAPQPWLVLDSYDVPQYGDLGLVAGGFEPMDQVKVSLEPAAGST